MSVIPELRTERLIMRSIKVKDANDMFEIFSNEEVIRYLSWKQHKSVEDSKRVIKAMLERHINLWAITLKGTGKVVGTISISAKDDLRIGEVGFILSQKYWNQGIMTEALIKVVEHGFNEMNFCRVEARCVYENEASAKLLEKTGFIFQGLQEKSLNLKGKVYDAKLFAILKLNG